MNDFVIRLYSLEDREEVVRLWEECGLVVPWNDPMKDINGKPRNSPEQLFVGTIEQESDHMCVSIDSGTGDRSADHS